MERYEFYNSVDEINIDEPYSLVFCCDKESSEEDTKNTIRRILETPCVDFYAIGKYGDYWEMMFDDLLVKDNIRNSKDQFIITVSDLELNFDTVEDSILISNSDVMCFVYETKKQRGFIESCIYKINKNKM